MLEKGRMKASEMVDKVFFLGLGGSYRVIAL